MRDKQDPTKLKESDFIDLKEKKFVTISERTGEKPFLLKSMIYANAFNSHNQFCFFGKMGAGKSLTAIQQVNSLGETIFNDWKYKNVLDTLVFRRKEMIELFDACYKEDKRLFRIPNVILDDFTFDNMKKKGADIFEDALIKFWSVQRNLVANVFVTTPSFNLLPARLRSMDWVLCYVKKHNDRYAEVRYYRYSLSPTGKIFLTPYRVNGAQIIERYKYTAVPEDIRNAYKNMRDSYTYEGIQEMKDAYQFLEAVKTITKDKVKGFTTPERVVKDSQRALKNRVYQSSRKNKSKQ